ncbi:MAG: outer membrane protein transport protein [Melioribacteraceae bacterium]
MKFKTLFFTLTFLLGLFFVNVSAQNFNDAFRLAEPSLDFDSRTMAMGNSTLALGGNFASTLLNPAGLALLSTNVVELSFNSNSLQNSSTFFDVNKTSKKNNGNFNQFALVMPLPTKKGSAVLAFGYNQLKDFNSKLEFDGFNPSNTSMIQTLNGEDIIFELGLSYPAFDVANGDTSFFDETIINGGLHQSGTIIEDGTLDSWVMSGAFEASKNVFIGATINILSGTYKYSRKYIEDDYDKNNYVDQLDPQDSRTANFESFLLNDVIDQQINGWDLRLGLLYKMNNMLSFGATIKLPTNYDIEEFYQVSGESEFASTAFSYESTEAQYNYAIKTPMELSGGIALDLPFIKVNGSVKLVDFSQMEFTEGFESKVLADKNQEFTDLFESTINFNLGTELTLPYPKIKLRGGFIYNQSPFKNDTAEFDKKFLTTGFGFPLSDGINIDVTYAHGWWNTFGDNYGVNESRTTQEISVDKIMMSLSFSFM